MMQTARFVARIFFQCLLYAALCIMIGVAGIERTGVFVSSFEVFIFSVIICHLWFYYTRKSNTKDITKYIEYAYLTFALIGLLGALEIDAKVAGWRAEEREPFITATLARIGEFAHSQRELTCNNENINRFYDAGHSFSKLCDFYNKYIELIEKKPDPKEWNKFIDDNLGYFSPNKPYFVEYLTWQMRIYLKCFIDQEELIKKSESNTNIYHMLGFFLIAAGLGLRITKVTIELRNWYIT